MPNYISLLRGINISGQKLIKMADLRSLYESFCFKRVETYIQSGNVIFESDNTNQIELKTIIEQGIEEKYGFHVPVEIRNQLEFEQILQNCPFQSINLAAEGFKYLVSFLSSIPPEEKVSEFQSYVIPPEELFIINREIYFHSPNGYGKSKLTNNFFENKLNVKATTRNWKTMNKLVELLKQSE